MSEPNKYNQFRIRYGLTQAQCARLMNTASSTYRCWEKGTNSTSKGIAEAFMREYDRAEGLEERLRETVNRFRFKDEWQPIETAPKDGTRMLLLWADQPSVLEVYVGKWDTHRKAWCCNIDGYMIFEHMMDLRKWFWKPLNLPKTGE